MSGPALKDIKHTNAEEEQEEDEQDDDVHVPSAMQPLLEQGLSFPPFAKYRAPPKGSARVPLYGALGLAFVCCVTTLVLDRLTTDRPAVVLARPAAAQQSLERWTRPFDPTGIQELCRNTSFEQNRWIVCEGIQGGSANLRNLILSCLRQTIQTGSGFVVPRFHLRGALENPEVNLHTGGWADLAFHFDTGLFHSRLAQACPELPVARTLIDIPLYRNATAQQSSWTLAGLAQPSQDTPMVVYTPPPLFTWQPYEEPSAVWQNFGLLLNPAPIFLGLADEVRDALFKTANGSFLGVHLRLEADVSEAMGSYNAQLQQVLERLKQTGLTSLYVACGDPTAIVRLQTDLATALPQVKLTSKWDLLSPISTRLLQELHFDQQAWVDYLVLTKADYFVGVAMSSFSSLISLYRDTAAKPLAHGLMPVNERLSSLIGDPYLRSRDWP